MAKEKKKRRWLSTIILIIAMGVFCYSAYMLITTLLEYRQGEEEYDQLKQYTSVVVDNDQEDQEPAEEGEQPAEKAVAPIQVDFESLQAINSDIVGWIYMEAIPTIDYPMVQSTDNDYYLHRTFEKKNNFAGSIFVDFANKSDFSDCNTIVYGHNMKNQSMFGLLKFMKTQEKYDESPYFWILTPQGDYRYQIFSCRDVPINDETYTLFSGGGPEFQTYLEKMQNQSDINAGFAFTGEEHIVTLSTCTSSDNYRCVIQGVRIDE